jgi:aryl-alcohol dehydrogenase-like predicted oxidoreductase
MPTGLPRPLSRRALLAASPGLLLAAAEAPSVPEYRRAGMTYRRLGKTGMDVSLLSFGSHTDPADRVRVRRGKTVLTAKGQARRDRILTRAFDYGVNLLDVYDSEGQWEPAASLLKPRRQKILVSLAHEVTPADIDKACRMFGHVDLYRLHTAALDGKTLAQWDLLRKYKEAGRIRAIGIATHIEPVMNLALDELEGIDFIYFPYNFIHARADYGDFIPRAVAKGVGLIGMKPLASGSIMQLDPKARPGAKPEFEALQLWQTRNRPILPAAVAELTRALDRTPDETLCMAAMRFAYSRPFLSTAIAGMFQEELLEDNYKALARYQKSGTGDRAALDAARRLARALDGDWLADGYRWLEEQWRA